jgi:hypothetical protein
LIHDVCYYCAPASPTYTDPETSEKDAPP